MQRANETPSSPRDLNNFVPGGIAINCQPLLLVGCAQTLNKQSGLTNANLCNMLQCAHIVVNFELPLAPVRQISLLSHGKVFQHLPSEVHQ